jgi:hypothetical protein
MRSMLGCAAAMGALFLAPLPGLAADMALLAVQ